MHGGFARSGPHTLALDPYCRAFVYETPTQRAQTAWLTLADGQVPLCTAMAPLAAAWQQEPKTSGWVGGGMRCRWQPRRSVELVAKSGTCSRGVAPTRDFGGEAACSAAAAWDWMCSVKLPRRQMRRS